MPDRHKIFFRADGNAVIGLGHVIRLISLANMLDDLYQCAFIINRPSLQLKRLIKSRFTLKEISFETSSSNEIKYICDRIVKAGDIIVLDGYNFDENYRLALKNKGCKLICIDDHQSEYYNTDLVINHAPNVDKSRYKVSKNTQFALGINYVLIRQEFLREARKNRVIKHCLKSNKSEERLFICFGGADLKNHTLNCLEIAMCLNLFKHIDVVIGSEYKYVNQIEDIIQNKDTIQMYRGIDAKSMISLMNRASVCLVPASGILFEALCTKSIIISGITAGNQTNIYEGFLEMRSIIPAGTFQREELIHAFEIINTPLQLNPIDGKSSVRIRKLFDKLQNEDTNIS